MAIALIIIGVTLWYSNELAHKIAREEHKKVKLIADAYKEINTAELGAANLTFVSNIIIANSTVPIIITDDNDAIIMAKNFDTTKINRNPEFLSQQLQIMKNNSKPVEIDIDDAYKHYLYFKESYLLTQLRYFPYVQFGLIGLFLLISYVAFSTARKAEQNQVWVGMAKETAHQLGTPLSSMHGWIELLKEKAIGNEDIKKYLSEIENDTGRLELIAERFSKIGSTPDLTETNMKEHVSTIVDYVKKRSSENAQFEINGEENSTGMINQLLFSWVIENLLKNALDSMEGKGKIAIHVEKGDGYVALEITDSGKGIPKSRYKTVFQPGYSTKKRGWGLGLSLSKRIIENYHNGKIFVKESVIGHRTTFRIVLPGSNR